MLQDEIYLRRAIRLAMNGRGLVEPNPMVGCVIVKNGRVIGEGFHQQYGHPHAEPNALTSCTESPAGATAYVTLEPCCHTNKQTPPCAPRLVAAKISRVVIGCLDPNPDVNGKGLQQLRDAGIVVHGSLLEAECKQLIAPFIARTHHGHSYFTMKWAESVDGKIAGARGKRVQISNPASSHQVQLLRSRCDAILVGINTVLNDDPLLLPRGVPMLRPYRRIVLDRKLRLPLDSQLVQSVDRGPVIDCTDMPPDSEPAIQLAKAGVQVVSDRYFNESRLSHILTEPGRTLAKTIGIYDRLWVIRSPNAIGDESAPSAGQIPESFVKTGEIDLAGDRLTEYLNAKSKVFFAPVPSADFVLAQTEPGRVGPDPCADRGDTPRL
jgi:diaminohydroxyphosphoribosylaminopyrimidine deaminase/5-amino-6-(5-phosphoribosylamino)uracil reductase